MTAIDDVKRANVIVTDENAYVAVMLSNGAKGEVTNQLEKQIADKVKGTDPDIENVFVSSNPAFFERMNDYAESIANGDPIEGFFEEFNETIRRIPPNARYKSTLFIIMVLIL
ncbi:YhcN/YlaJ family sporulation lipoprotein (plasmid) [Bacillus sp. F19]|nr:YhcN/YlaJ family sporulation lipoprotein [Bacillus sp. F19]